MVKLKVSISHGIGGTSTDIRDGYIMEAINLDSNPIRIVSGGLLGDDKRQFVFQPGLADGTSSSKGGFPFDLLPDEKAVVFVPHGLFQEALTRDGGAPTEMVKARFRAEDTNYESDAIEVF